MTLEVQHTDLQDEIRFGLRRYTSFEPLTQDYCRSLQERIIFPLMQERGLEAYEDTIREVSSLLTGGLLQSVREVEVMLMGCVEPRDTSTPVAQAYLAKVEHLCSAFLGEICSKWRYIHYIVFIDKMQAILTERDNEKQRNVLAEILDVDDVLDKNVLESVTNDVLAEMELDYSPTSSVIGSPVTTALVPPPDSSSNEKPSVATETLADSSGASFPPNHGKLYCPVQGCVMARRGFNGTRRHQQSNLTRHVRIIHLTRVNYDCLECGQRFTRSDNLRKHRRTKHQIDDPPRSQRTRGIRRADTF